MSTREKTAAMQARSTLKIGSKRQLIFWLRLISYCPTRCQDWVAKMSPYSNCKNLASKTKLWTVSLISWAHSIVKMESSKRTRSRRQEEVKTRGNLLQDKLLLRIAIDLHLERLKTQMTQRTIRSIVKSNRNLTSNPRNKARRSTKRKNLREKV